MTLHRVDKPSDLCNVDISDQNLHSVKTEDFEEFDNVVYVNASENHLTLDPFSKFPILKQLELSLNGLHNLKVNARDFPHLEILDLSYNNLSSDDIQSIGLLPCLKVLHLSGNELRALPDSMAKPHYDSAQMASDQDVRFRKLEVLMLDDNKLCSPGVFHSLASLTRLQHLNLEGNYITEVPYLPQMEDLLDLQNCSRQQSEELGHGKVLVSASERLVANDTSVERPGSDQSLQEDGVCPKSYSPLQTPLLPEAKMEFTGELHLPLPELKFLNLANNRIVLEEALLAVALFPSLSELVIHSNPLTTQRSGDPPMLTHFLQERLGIEIRRKKTAQLVKPHIVIPLNPKRKVNTKIRKVPKLPLQLETDGISFLNGYGYSMENNAKELQKNLIPTECKSVPSDCFSQMSTHVVEEAQGLTSDDGLKTVEGSAKDIPGAYNQDGDTFFITQVNDSDKSKWQVKSEDLELESEEQREGSVPKKFRGYEILLDAKTDPYMFEPVGIQHTVRALELALKNILVYRDSKANLESPQKSYTVKEKRVTKLPSAKPRKLKGERVEDALTQMRDRKTMKQVPLDKVLKGKDVYKEEYEEALTLLRDIKKKYQVVHMKAVEEAAQVEHEKHMNLHGNKANQE
ncbi:hypothetical protein MATL_G00042590 [Megalops atlanticus]|uniref:X-ray radiation resistance-associated protein 1 n=1 Tax=Megalops atlanticus TaxID=7932 RepID=A0A9D3TIC6_MEGAT|nr:hypothetical protein MATL_G00042590 [Megalops atlanticus]